MILLYFNRYYVNIVSDNNNTRNKIFVPSDSGSNLLEDIGNNRLYLNLTTPARTFLCAYV